MKKRYKLAQAQIITTVLIILLVLSAIVIVWNVVTNTVTPATGQVSDSMDCLTGVDVEVVGSCYEETIPGVRWQVEVEVKNNGANNYKAGDLLVKMNYDDGSAGEKYNLQDINQLEQKKITFDIFKNPENAQHLLIPKLSKGGEKLVCYEKAIEFTPEVCN